MRRLENTMVRGTIKAVESNKGENLDLTVVKVW